MRGILVVLAVLLVAPGRALADEVRGTVVDDSGKPVADAIVTIGDDDATTGADGRFTIANLPPGPLDAIVIAGDQAPALVTIAAADRGDARLVLAPAHRGEVIEVSGAPPDLAEPTEYTLDRDHVRSLPGTGNDVLRAVQSVPGVGRTSYGLIGLVLRGTDPNDTKVYLDGIEVPIAFHFAGLSSFYPSSLLDQMTVTPGGAEARFGRGIGGVVELTSRAPRRDRVRAGGEVGILDASVFGEAPTFHRGAVAVGLRRSYIELFLDRLLPKKVDDARLVPRYYDGQLRWDVPLAGGTLSTIAFFSDDRLDMKGGLFTESFARTALRWTRPGRVRWTVLPWAGFDSIRTDAKGDQPGRVDQVGTRAPIGLRVEAAHDAAWGDVAAGVDIQVAHEHVITTEISDDPQPSVEHVGWFADLGVWADARWRIADGKLTLRPGVRVDHLGIPDAWTFDPRVVVTHELTSWLTLREDFGLYHQPPAPAALFDDKPIDRAAASAVHASIGANVRIPDDVHLAATVYDVEMGGPHDTTSSSNLDLPISTGLSIVLDNLLDSEFASNPPQRGRASGLELSLQKQTRRWMLWGAYTLSRSERTCNCPNLDGWFPVSLDQTHNLSLVSSVVLGAWQLGARFRYVTGFPYAPQISPGGGGILDGVYGRFGSARLPAFESLDLRVDHRWTTRLGVLAAFADVTNVTWADNPEGIYYDDDGTRHYLSGTPILPQIGVSLTP